MIDADRYLERIGFDDEARPDLDTLGRSGATLAIHLSVRNLGLPVTFTSADPNDPDGDKDGLTDGDEVLVHGTDPRKAFTDAGGHVRHAGTALADLGDADAEVRWWSERTRRGEG